MKLYIATLFENWRNAKALAAALEGLGYKIVCPWWAVAETLEDAPQVDDHARVLRNRRNAVADIAGVVECDALVHLWTPENRGAWAEHGAALALGKRVLFLAPYERLRDLWSVFSFHPLCQRLGCWVDGPGATAQLVSNVLAAPLPADYCAEPGCWVESDKGRCLKHHGSSNGRSEQQLPPPYGKPYEPAYLQVRGANKAVRLSTSVLDTGRSVDAMSELLRAMGAGREVTEVTPGALAEVRLGLAGVLREANALLGSNWEDLNLLYVAAQLDRFGRPIESEQGKLTPSDLAGLAARKSLPGARKPEPHRCECSDCDER